jgi:hypothetical protein
MFICAAKNGFELDLVAQRFTEKTQSYTERYREDSEGIELQAPPITNQISHQTSDIGHLIFPARDSGRESVRSQIKIHSMCLKVAQRFTEKTQSYTENSEDRDHNNRFNGLQEYVLKSLKRLRYFLWRFRTPR